MIIVKCFSIWTIWDQKYWLHELINNITQWLLYVIVIAMYDNMASPDNITVTTITLSDFQCNSSFSSIKVSTSFNRTYSCRTLDPPQREYLFKDSRNSKTSRSLPSPYTSQNWQCRRQQQKVNIVSYKILGFYITTNPVLEEFLNLCFTLTYQSHLHRHPSFLS